MPLCVSAAYDYQKHHPSSLWRIFRTVEKLREEFRSRIY